MECLKSLPAQPSGAILFTVPETRVEVLWQQLKAKCLGSGLSLGDDVHGVDRTWTAADGRILAITSWSVVLGRLRLATRNTPAMQQDIAQLKGLTDTMNVDTFLPLVEAEVTGVCVPRRLINYIEMIDEISNRLAAEGHASTKGLQSASTYTNVGRYLALLDRFIGWIGIELTEWKISGLTPMQFRLYTRDNLADLSKTPPQKLAGHFEGARATKDTLYIPADLAVGVDRSQVIDHAVKQMHDIGRTLLNLFPSPDAQSGPSKG